MQGYRFIGKRNGQRIKRIVLKDGKPQPIEAESEAFGGPYFDVGPKEIERLAHLLAIDLYHHFSISAEDKVKEFLLKEFGHSQG